MELVLGVLSRSILTVKPITPGPKTWTDVNVLAVWITLVLQQVLVVPIRMMALTHPAVQRSIEYVRSKISGAG